MRRPLLIITLFVFWSALTAGIVEKTFYFHQPRIDTTGIYQTITFPGTSLSGIPGEPSLPWKEISLMLPPGESAESIAILTGNVTMIPGHFNLYPWQDVQPISSEKEPEFRKNEQIYTADASYPSQSAREVQTQYLNGFAFALSAFTPLKYNPVTGKVSYYGRVTVRITTKSAQESVSALKNLPATENIRDRAAGCAQNPEMKGRYPRQRASSTSYQYLIISPTAFRNEFQPLVNMYSAKGIITKIVTTDSLNTYGTGTDLPMKIRNYIISEYVNSQIEYVLLAGNPPLVPIRGFYCYVNSGSGYTDIGIPADLYYSGVDGNYNADNDQYYGEVNDNPDLLPDVSVGRFTVNDTAELHHMIQKSVSYQTNPVIGELNRPFLVGEYLYPTPMTFGGPYMNLLVDDHNDNGYFTHGIQSSTNNISKLYDTLIAAPSSIWQWTASSLVIKLNQGKAFIHHLGHSNTVSVMRLGMTSIDNSNFASVNGITHNFQILYTQGCYCGAFDVSGGCIAAKMVTINNFLVAGIFNSRYGWFNQGTTDGPSEHLEREFVSALYNDTLPEKHIGTVQMISKIKTAPWISQENEFEPGAQRWCHYCCNLFGDPAMEIWTGDPAVFTQSTWTGAIDNDWNKAGNWSPAGVPTTISDVLIPPVTRAPVINITALTICHDLRIQNGANVTISPGKTVTVWGSVILDP